VLTIFPGKRRQTADFMIDVTESIGEKSAFGFLNVHKKI